jgi:hypothetical protein
MPSQVTNRASLPTLPHLIQDLRQARDDLVAIRADTEPGKAGRIAAARWALLEALEAYISALDARCLPVPYSLRDEWRLHRNIRRYL